MLVTSVKKIQPQKSRCIEVAGPDRLFAAGGPDGRSIVSHNSVTQRTIINSCIMRPNRWRILGIDLKKVELSRYRKYSNVVLGVATEMEDALTVLKFAQQTMMKRYEEMERLGVNDFRKLPEKGYSLLVMCDEIAELFGVSGNKTEEAKAKDAMAGECQFISSSILRLGRAAGVHMVQATQRPDAKYLPGEAKANMPGRCNNGRTDATASSMILGNAEGTRVKGHPRGRLYLQINGEGDHAQGFFASEEWLDEWLESKGLNPDGTPIGTGKQSRLATLVDMDEFSGGDLDSRSGVDNSAAIDRISQEDEWGFEDPDGSMGRPVLGGGTASDDDYDEWDDLMVAITSQQ